uniref:Calmodulin-binding protein n=1 Tax=Musa acuminata subsp. malaccensis TaxID=214687 RepID=A0A804HU28_MUSAM|nr:PREDICTED: protein SAR DEFICIENT 1-like [Musa acuminata subsp. malaccensis]
MAAKRLRDDPDKESEPSEEKQMRRLPSFSTVIKEAMMAKSLNNFFFALEPLLRRVVKEEVERGVIHSMRSFQRSTPMQIEAAAESSSFKLTFNKQLSLPIFTGSKIDDIESKPLQIVVVDVHTGEVPLSTLSSPLKVEVVVLDGDFPSGDQEDWTGAEFQNNIVKERTGKRPLLTGDVNVTLRDGAASISDLCFTDNSSWIRSRHFRIGARVVPGSHNAPRIREAITEPFMVKDHRGELYKKHYPPALGDEVWRLERIGKDGAFHKKLSAVNINTVQDFLKLLAVDPHRLRSILGVGMSDRMWEGTVAHAKTCEVGDKRYVHRAPQCSLVFNAVCEVVEIISDDMTLTLQSLSKPQRAYVNLLVREAHQNWDSLEDADAFFDQSIVAANVQMQQSEIEPFPWHEVEENAIEYQLEDYEIPDPAQPSF